MDIVTIKEMGKAWECMRLNHKANMLHGTSIPLPRRFSYLLLAVRWAGSGKLGRVWKAPFL